jgi:hypothetical protein
VEINQKKRSNRLKFTFNDDSFNYAYKDRTGSGDIDVQYAGFPTKASVSIERNEWLRNAGLIWCVIGVLQLGHAMITGDSLQGRGFWLLIGVICLVGYRWATVKYSVFRTQAGNVLVIQDREHDRIVDEINRRRKDQLLALYGELDMRNTLEDEIAKFSWLHEQDVLSKDNLRDASHRRARPFRRRGRQHPASFIDGCAGETGAMRCCPAPGLAWLVRRALAFYASDGISLCRELRATGSGGEGTDGPSWFLHAQPLGVAGHLEVALADLRPARARCCVSCRPLVLI